MFGGGVSCILILAAIVGFATQLVIWPRSTAHVATPMPGSDFRKATIVSDALDDSGCHQRNFDNQTGRITQTEQPCNNGVRLDNNGIPVPVGTIHRLDGISRSFSGH
jgi:hypothetical protein